MGRTFTYEEALALFPRVRELTAAAVEQVEALTGGVAGSEAPEEEPTDIEEAFQEVVGRWARRLTRLGVEVKGLWLVDFDSGDGYYCWRWPEESLAFFHERDAGFAGRLPLQ